MRCILSSLTLLVVVVSGIELSAQHAAHSAAPEQPATLLPGLGAYSHPIVSSNPETQKYFDQGLRLLYGFNRYEALRSFRKAAELDPSAVMPLWGVSVALGPHVNMDLDGDVNLAQSCEAAARARQIAQRASAYERAYLEALSARCPSGDPERFIAAMRDLHERYPDDLDAATLYAESLLIKDRWQWWLPDGSPTPATVTAVEVLEQVLRRRPDHPGANHFYIHAVEMSPSPERAIPSAQRLMGIMPAAGHMVHMPAHIWLLIGDWETAAQVNERAAQMDRDYFARTGVQSEYRGYLIHNLQFVFYARSMQGRSQAAIAAADSLVRESSQMADQMPEMADLEWANGIFARLRFARWKELLALPAPDPKFLGSLAIHHWARAIAFAAKGEHSAATREAQLFRQAKANIPAARAWTFSKAADVMELADAVLLARLSPDPKASVPYWRRAVALQDRLRYDEPPAWYMPLRESLGAALLRSGDASEAEAVFREGLHRSAQNGRMLFGLMKSLESQHKTEAASLVRLEFQRVWQQADMELHLEDM